MCVTVKKDTRDISFGRAMGLLRQKLPNPIHPEGPDPISGATLDSVSSAIARTGLGIEAISLPSGRVHNELTKCPATFAGT